MSYFLATAVRRILDNWGGLVVDAQHPLSGYVSFHVE